MAVVNNAPRMLHARDRIIAHVQNAQAWNDPRVSSGVSESSRGKPQSRPPGETQCEGFVAELARILEDALKRCDAASERANPRQRGSGATVKSIGGVAVTEEPTEPVVPYRRKVSDDVRVQTLVAKYQGVAEAQEA